MWYFANAGEYEGPYQEDYLGRQLRRGAIHRGTLVWREGMAAWLPLGQTELAKLLVTQMPWQTSARGEPKPQVAEGSRPSQAAVQNHLEAYEQSGFEKPQLLGQRIDASQPRSSTERKSRTVSSPYSWLSIAGLTQVATVLLALSAAASLLQVARFFVFVWPSEYHFYATFPPVLQGEQLYAALFFLTWSVCLLWFLRALHNLQTLGDQAVGMRPIVVFASFFAPILHLFYPYLAMRHLWNRSHAPSHLEVKRVSPVASLFWLGWILSGFFEDGIFHIQIGRHELYYTKLVLFAQLLPGLLGFITPLLAILFMRAIWRAQQEAHIAGENG